MLLRLIVYTCKTELRTIVVMVLSLLVYTCKTKQWSIVVMRLRPLVYTCTTKQWTIVVMLLGLLVYMQDKTMGHTGKQLEMQVIMFDTNLQASWE